MVSVCLPSDALLQHLPSYLGFSYLERGVSLYGCSSKAQPLLLTLDEGYLLTAAFPDLQRGIAPLGKRNPSKMVGVARGHQRADTLKPYSQKTSQSNHTKTTALSNSVKLSHARGATQDGWVMVERSDRMRSTGEGNGKPLQYSCLENPMNSSMKRQNDRIPKEELPRSLGAQYATGDQWRNNSRKNEGMEPKQKQYPAVDVTGERSKV